MASQWQELASLEPASRPSESIYNHCDRLPYLPFLKKSGHLGMGLESFPIEEWIEIDANFEHHLQTKAQLLSSRHRDVFAALPATTSAQAEVLSLLTRHLLVHCPTVYQPLNDGIRNLKTQETWQFADFAQAPLDLAGRLVQEDLCLLLPADAGYYLAAASVCFPLRWRLCDKMGQPMGHIHQRVPGYAKKLKRPVDNVFARLREGFPGLRFNWSVVDSSELFLGDDKFATVGDRAITAGNAGQMLWLRVERQTIRRLPVSQGILFTIRTHVYSLGAVAEMADVAARLGQAIRALEPEMQAYKNLLPFRGALLGYLGERAAG